MSHPGKISGFSKLSKEEKIALVSKQLTDRDSFIQEVKTYWHPDEEIQQRFDDFSENTITNYPLPYGVAPNFLINGKVYIVPMVIEESSVVAAASNSAKFWFDKGGFKAGVRSKIKPGQVYFSWSGDFMKLNALRKDLKNFLVENTRHLTRRMEERGGGIIDIDIFSMDCDIENMYQLRVSFDTADSMGANFINTCLEEFGVLMEKFIADHKLVEKKEDFEVIMAILSNYTPQSIVECHVETELDNLDGLASGLSGAQFAEKFRKAVLIADADPYRAATHNKGIFNGIDAVAIATGNDFRAIEADGHTYAARTGRYASLTRVNLTSSRFRYTLELPLSVGTVGGLTRNHPLARRSMELLNNPDASSLMEIIAAAGLANNFSAIKSLITSGIQKGHMKMHLNNILSSLGASDSEREKAAKHFQEKTVSYSDVKDFLESIRSN
jgi:hydroxymethylglutaryl-CoA reductase